MQHADKQAVIEPQAEIDSHFMVREPLRFRQRFWFYAATAILLVAAFVRLYDLELKPLHHDEGVNGYFQTRLVREGFYRYDPENFHGPLLYYVTLPGCRLFGLTTFSIRLVPALLGVATVFLILSLRRRLGTTGSLAAATLIAVSPGAVFFSRYFIHESLLVLLSVAMIAAALQLYDTGQVRYLILVALSGAFLFATKETAVISAGVYTIALVVSVVYSGIRKTPRAGSAPRPLVFPGGEWKVVIGCATAVSLFAIVIAALYSSFFANPRWAMDLAATLKFWATAGRTDHIHPWYSHIRWLGNEELPLLVLGIVGIALALWRADKRFSIFAALWGIGLITAYSIIPYKTPWLSLNFIPPLAVSAGYVLQTLQPVKPGLRRLAPAAILTIAVVLSSYEMVRLNFFEFDDEKHAYVYAHTSREVKAMTDEIAAIAYDGAAGSLTTIDITSPYYWPLPWYLRNYKYAVFHAKVIESSSEMIICSTGQEEEMAKMLADRYERVNRYRLRQGVDLVLYVRRDVFDKVPRRSMSTRPGTMTSVAAAHTIKLTHIITPS